MATSIKKGKGDVNLYIDVISNAEKAIADTMKAFKKMKGKMASETALGNIVKQQAIIDKAMKAQERAIMGPKKAFQGWAMSIMFAGMAVQNTMKQIWTASSKTFNDVMHSTEGTVTSFDRLTGSLTYLWFVIGEALSPLADIITPIVDGISEWVSNNPELTEFSFVIAAIAGSLSFIGGSVVLASAGFSEFFTIIKSSSLVSFLADMDKLPTSADKLKNYDWGSVGTAIKDGVGMVSIAVGAVLAAESISDFSSGKFFDSALNAAGAYFSMVGGAKMLTGKGGGPFILIAAGLKLIEENVFFTSISYLGGLLLGFFVAIGRKIGATLQNGIVESIKAAILSIIDIISTAFGGTLFTLAFGKSPGRALADLTGIKQAQTPDFMTLYKEEIAKFVKGGKLMDQGLQQFKSDVDSLVSNSMKPPVITNNYGPESNQALENMRNAPGNTYLTINMSIDPNKSFATEFEKVLFDLKTRGI